MSSTLAARRLTPLALALALAGALSLPAAHAAPHQGSDAITTSRPSQDTSSALVQLNGAPLSTYVKTKPAKGKKIDFGNTNVKSYRAQLSALPEPPPWAQACGALISARSGSLAFR